MTATKGSGTIRLEAKPLRFVPAGAAPRPAARPPAPDPEKLRQAELARARGEERQAAEARAAAQLAAQLAARQAAQREACERCGGKFERFLSELKAHTGEEVIDLALQVAEIVVRHTLPDPAMLREVVREVLEPLGEWQGARVRVHPADAEALRAADPARALPLLMSEQIELQSDPSLQPGDVFIESRTGCFDGRLAQRLERLGQRLQERYRHDHNAPAGA
jgi:flagellar assembly protein FliH